MWIKSAFDVALYFAFFVFSLRLLFNFAFKLPYKPFKKKTLEVIKSKALLRKTL